MRVVAQVVGTQQVADATVTVGSPGTLPAGFQMPAPPIIARTVTGQAVSSLQNGTKYVNCTVSASMWLTGTNSAPVQDLWFTGCTFSGTFGPKGAVRRIRIDGGEFGHVRDGGQSQIKPNPVTGTDPCPSDIEITNARFTDCQRTTSGVHIEGLQIGGAQRLWVHGCTFDRDSIYGSLLRSWIGVAGIDYAPIEDILYEGNVFQATTNTVDTGSGSGSLAISDQYDTGGRMNQAKRICFRNNRCAEAISIITGGLEAEGLLCYGNTKLDAVTPLVRSAAGGSVKYS